MTEPFKRKHLETSDDIVSVRLSKTERPLLDSLKNILSADGDSTVLKIGMAMLFNVIHGTYGETLTRWIASRDRVRWKK